MALIYLSQAPGQCLVLALSTDTKPGGSDGMVLIETDTGKIYTRSANTWVDRPADDHDAEYDAIGSAAAAQAASQPLDADLTALAAANNSSVLAAVTASFTTADETKLDGIETAATADQSNAEIETAYNAQVGAASQAEAEAGTETAIRRFSPLRVAQAIAALGTGGGVDTANSPNANEFARFTDADTIEGRTVSEARTDLGLAIGTNVQAFSANLDEYAAVNPTTAGLALLDDADAAAQRTTMGAAANSHTHDWADVTGEPTTLAGYGITDGATDGELAAHEADTTSVHGIVNTASLALLTTKLDDFSAPDDNTDLNASVSAHGLMQKYPGGTATFLRADGAFASAGGAGSSATTVEADIGVTPKFAGKFTITDAAISGTSKVMCWQAPGPYTGKGTRADEAEMQPVQVVSVEPGSGSAVVKWQTPPMSGMVREVQAGRLNAAGATFDRLGNQRWPDVFSPVRIGRVRGNVKFSYVVFA